MWWLVQWSIGPECDYLAVLPASAAMWLMQAARITAIDAFLAADQASRLAVII